MQQLTLFCLLISSIILFSACESDPCADTVCGNFSYCDDGDCECDPGYQTSVNGGCVLADPCANINCQNGTCNNGICDCNSGYALDSNGECTQRWNNGVSGVWTVNDNCTSSGMSTYNVNINALTGDAKYFVIVDFRNVFTEEVLAEMTSENTFKIVYQQPDLGGDFVQSNGSATINAARTEITITYQVEDINNGSTNVCTSVWTKQ